MNKDLKFSIEDERILGVDKDIEKSKKETEVVLKSNNYYKYTGALKSTVLKGKTFTLPFIISALIIAILIVIIIL